MVEKEFFDEMHPSLMDRLGKVYNDDSEYQKAVKKEAESFNQLEKNCTESQLEMVREYRDLIYAAGGVCEMLAYRQGMRDLAEILGIGGRKNR